MGFVLLICHALSLFAGVYVGYKCCTALDGKNRRFSDGNQFLGLIWLLSFLVPAVAVYVTLALFITEIF